MKECEKHERSRTGMQRWIGTAVQRRRRGGTPPPHDPPPLLPFQCLRLTAKLLLRRLRCQEDLRFKIVDAPPAGTIGGPWEEGGFPAKAPPPPLPLKTPPFPSPPSPSNTALGRRCRLPHSPRC